jgi:hypothetical protein
MNDRFAILAFVSTLIVVILALVGDIIWVHYYYLPHLSVTPESAASFGAPINHTSETPSPKTETAMQAIQHLIQQHWTFLDAIPTPLVLTSVSTTEPTTFSYLGLTFSTPWSSVSITSEDGNPPELVEIDFANGRRVTLIRASTSSAATLAEWNSLSSNIKTDYDLDTAAFSATPSDVTSSTPGNQAILVSTLLTLKTSLWISPGPIYSFKTGAVEGFQFGDATTTRPVGIEIYDDDNHAYLLTIKGTQEEIDYILSSSK